MNKSEPVTAMFSQLFKFPECGEFFLLTVSLLLKCKKKNTEK